MESTKGLGWLHKQIGTADEDLLRQMSRVPRTALLLVATMVRSIFAQPEGAEVWAQHVRVVTQLQERFADAAALLAGYGEEILAFAGFAKAHRRQIWSNNPQERLNREIRRRTDVVGIFPNRAAIIRLVGAVLAEQNDEWIVSRRYMSCESQAKTPKVDKTEQEVKALAA